MTLIILFGIIGGIFTPTEASIVAVIYALIIGFFVYRKLNIRNVISVIMDSMKTSASLMVLIGFANLFRMDSDNRKISSIGIGKHYGIFSKQICCFITYQPVADFYRHIYGDHCGASWYYFRFC